MKKLLKNELAKVIFQILFAVVFLWLLFAFIFLSLNPANWEIYGRGCYLISLLGFLYWIDQ
jgi:hypothetical protein